MAYRINKYYPIKTSKGESLFFKIGEYRGRAFARYPWMALYEKKRKRFLFWHYTDYIRVEREWMRYLITQDEVRELEKQSPFDADPAIRLALLRLVKLYESSHDNTHSF